jgi:membrane-bound acyltransferase YfiQ involved in biofilm formation
MSFAIYLIGFIIFIAGVAWALMTAGVDTVYIAITSLILLGIGIMIGVSKTRTKDHNT